MIQGYEMTIDIPEDKLIAGVDEVGRGPLVGDVVTAAVILDPANPIEGLADSKKLSEKKRLALFGEIKEKALAYAIGRASPAEIDELNILHATMLAMQRAVAGLKVTPELVFIDGNRCPRLPMEARAVVKGDARSLSIAAASLVAKLLRDRIMVDLAQQHPGYGWEVNAGYPTPRHRRALLELGITPYHRRSFAPVHNILCKDQTTSC